MEGQTERSRTLRAPLDAALEEQIGRLELRISQVWQVLGGVGVVGALVLGATVSPSLGVWGGLAAAAFLGWFTLQTLLLKRGMNQRPLRIVSTVIESCIPWVFLLVLYAQQGAAYVLGSWVPPLLVAALLLASTARLRPIVPLLIGASAGIAFPALYFLLLRDALPASALDQPLYQPAMQITRGVSLFLGGALAMLVAHALRRAIGKAESAVREKDLFGKYRLVRHLASGGMGTVYEAVYCPEGGFERPVAIKRVHPHLARQRSFVDAFRTEAELSARLAHPNVVQVLDFGSIDDSYFLAMEYVDGLTLQALMRRMRRKGRKLDPRIVAHIGREILAGLSYSHRGARAPDGSLLRVIHRDLCPPNVLLSRNGEVKISDYGVAKALRDAEVAETKTVTGHAGYMAPEQARAEPIDERCDLYSLGIVLWEMITGKRLFFRGSEGPTMIAAMTEEVMPPTSLRDDIDPGWDDVLLRATERDVDERFTSAAEMAATIAALPEASGPCPDAIAALVSEMLAEQNDDDARQEREESIDNSQLPTRVVQTA